MLINDEKQQPFIQVNKVTKEFKAKSHQSVLAVDDVSLHIFKGETLGLIGESGSGKSTLGRMILRLLPITKGEILIDGRNLHDCDAKELKSIRKNFQIIFQDASFALDPRKTIKSILEEPLKLHNITKREFYEKEVFRLLDIVGLPKDAIYKRPHEFSGGEKQRITIAKALSTQPKFIICDEPLSALDVSVQAKILNLMTDIKKEFDLTYLFISHNMKVIHYMSDRISVMYAGKIVEQGVAEQIFNRPNHLYTKSLVEGFKQEA